MADKFGFDFWGFHYQIPLGQEHRRYYVLTTTNGTVMVLRNGGVHQGVPSLHRNFVEGGLTVEQVKQFYNQQGIKVAIGECDRLSIGSRN